MIEDIPEIQMAEKEIARLKESLRFCEDRLRPKRAPDTGAPEDEIDRLEFQLEMARQDKNRAHGRLVSLRISVQHALEALDVPDTICNHSSMAATCHLNNRIVEVYGVLEEAMKESKP